MWNFDHSKDMKRPLILGFLAPECTVLKASWYPTLTDFILCNYSSITGNTVDISLISSFQEAAKDISPHLIYSLIGIILKDNSQLD